MLPLLVTADADVEELDVLVLDEPPVTHWPGVPLMLWTVPSDGATRVEASRLTRACSTACRACSVWAWACSTSLGEPGAVVWVKVACAVDSAACCWSTWFWAVWMLLSCWARVLATDAWACRSD